MKSPTLHDLFQEILMARQRVYTVGRPTPLERLELDLDAEVFLKREDISPIYAYKWRGAFNRMATLSAAEGRRGVITASAGNHAQGVALAAQKLDLQARIYMPRATPQMKQIAVARHGGANVEIVLTGDTFDDAAAAAEADVAKSRRTFISPYDDLRVMGGQGTLADEIVMSGEGPFDAAFLQIGGGGMAAAVGCWLRSYYPGIRLYGVEGTDQASMTAAIKAGKPVRLPTLDVFCDGTAVRKAGRLTYPLCAQLLDEMVLVSNEEVCAAIQLLWEKCRAIPEPAGAMGLAGLLKRADELRGKRVLCILCGANMDFGRLAWIARHAGIGAARRRYLRCQIDERSGTMLGLLEAIRKGCEGLNIIEFQYGKTAQDRAWPVIGIEASPPELTLAEQRLGEMGIATEDVTGQEDVEFRMIHYNPALISHPYFIRLDFPERSGALSDFLQMIRGKTNMVYFNYVYGGGRVGPAMLGFEFDTAAQRADFRKLLKQSPWSYREISREVLDRIM